MRALWIALVLSLGLLSCNQDGSTTSKAEKTVEEIKAESKISNSKIIRNPISADQPVDTVNVAKISFEKEAYDFGTVQEGQVVEYTYKFTNTGIVPLVISNARSTCGCTVPEKPDGPIAPGAASEIKVKFNTKGKLNRQEKPVIITANTYPKETKVYLRGFVEKKEDKTASN